MNIARFAALVSAFIASAVAANASASDFEGLVMGETIDAVTAIFPKSQLKMTRIDDNFQLSPGISGLRFTYTLSDVSGEISERQEEAWNSHFDKVMAVLRSSYGESSIAATSRSFMYSKQAKPATPELIPEITFSVKAKSGGLWAYYRLDFVDRGSGVLNVVGTLLFASPPVKASVPDK
jgi:hypothetical protein